MLLLEDKMIKIAKQLDDCWYDDYVLDYKADYTLLDDYLHHTRCYTTHGASKNVVIVDGCSVVMKIPFHGMVFYENEYEYEDDEDDFPVNSEAYTEEFCYAGNEDNDWDYCENELSKYLDAVEDGFGDFFPKTTYYKITKAGIPIYLQEKVNHFDCNYAEIKKTDSYTKAKEIESSSNNYIRVSTYFIAECINYYGLEKTKAFIDYITNVKPEIGQDLHGNNVGRRIDTGAPVVLDFSGWREDF